MRNQPGRFAFGSGSTERGEPRQDQSCSPLRLTRIDPGTPGTTCQQRGRPTVSHTNRRMREASDHHHQRERQGTDVGIPWLSTTSSRLERQVDRQLYARPTCSAQRSIDGVPSIPGPRRNVPSRQHYWLTRFRGGATLTSPELEAAKKADGVLEPLTIHIERR